jgi:hypothetical protein
MTDRLTIRRGANFIRTFDSYTDATQATRIGYDGWRFLVQVAGQEYATDDDDPKLTVEAATDPTGDRLRLSLDATDTAALTDSATHLVLLRIDPADESNVEVIAGPTTVTVAGL